tara:strand:- start:528 stop:821 length:294 start_codon:yes stop_codon:yes gene_type:complete
MKKLNECRLVVSYHRVCDKRNPVPAQLCAGHHVELVELSDWRGNKNYEKVHYSNYFKSKVSAMAKLEKLRKQFDCNISLYEPFGWKYSNCENYFISE